jgi:hypothetical protein
VLANYARWLHLDLRLLSAARDDPPWPEGIAWPPSPLAAGPLVHPQSAGARGCGRGRNPYMGTALPGRATAPDEICRLLPGSLPEAGIFEAKIVTGANFRASGGVKGSKI